MYHGGEVREVFTFTPYLHLEGGGRGLQTSGFSFRLITCKGQMKEVDNKEMTKTKKEEEKEGKEVKDESLPEDFCCPKPTGRTSPPLLLELLPTTWEQEADQEIKEADQEMEEVDQEMTEADQEIEEAYQEMEEAKQEKEETEQEA